MSLLLELIERIGLGSADIRRIIDTAPARYRVYPIEKRHGGHRIIAQPSRELKAIQRYILESRLFLFPVHRSAMAYEKHRSIYKNADAHRGGNAILKLDFRDFFPSIKTGDWEAFAIQSRQQNIELGDLRLYSKILFWGERAKSTVPRCLSIGAPTSPALSNILLYKFDLFVSSLASAQGLAYTRYADDITISGDTIERVTLAEKEIRKFVRSMKHPKLQFNEEKRGVYTRGQRRMVTGLIITPRQEVSIGRDRKRMISSMLHRLSLNELDEGRMSYLKGMMGFCVANEPDFIDRLRLKYGNSVVDKAMKYHAPKRKRFLVSPPPVPSSD